jgi:hypothetical protein
MVLGDRMSRSSKIDQLGLSDKVLGYAASGMSQVAILEQLERERPGTNLNPASLCLYLKKHGQMLQERALETKDNEIKLTIESIRQALEDTANEVQRVLRECADDPRALAAFLKLKLETLDRMAKMLGAFAPETAPATVRIGITKVYRASIMDAIRDEPEAVQMKFLDTLERHALAGLGAVSEQGENEEKDDDQDEDDKL